MSTRAVYTFIDEDQKFHVYKHCDGYPSGAHAAIEAALNNAWELPRFEADEFGAAFIAANKEHSGNLRLTKGPSSHGDLEYRYEIYYNRDLMVKAFQVGYDAKDRQRSKQIFVGTLAAFEEFVNQESAA